VARDDARQAAVRSALHLERTEDIHDARRDWRGSGEFVAAERGLGFFIAFSTSFFKIPQAFAGLIVLVVLSLILFRLCVIVQRRFVPWSLPKSES